MDGCDVNFAGDGEKFVDGYGSLNSFYSIANSAIDNMQSSLSNWKKSQLYCAMNMDPDCGNYEIVDVTTSQFGIYFLTGTGGVIFLVMVAIAIFFSCCVRCCNNRCIKKKNDIQYEHSKVTAFISLSIQLVVYLVCFGYIIAGTIIFGLSVANFKNSIGTGNIYYAENLRDGCTDISRQGDSNLMCSYNQSILYRLSSLPNKTNAETQTLIDIWLVQSGLSGLNLTSQQNLDSYYKNDFESGTNSLQELNKLKTNPFYIGDQKAQDEIQNTINTVNACQIALQNLINYMPQVISASNSCLSDSMATQMTLETSIGSQNALLIQRLYRGEDKVRNVTRSVIDAGYESARWSSQLWTTIIIKMKNANNWGGLNAITSTADLVVILPASLMMLFIFISILICIFKIIGLFCPRANRGGEHGRIVANTLRGATYILMWLAVAPIIAAVGLIWYGQLYAGTCYNLYNPDQTIGFYNNIKQEYLKPIAYNQIPITVKYGSFLSYLHTSQTVWQALETSQSPLLTSSDFINDINPNKTEKNINSLIFDTNLNANYSQSVFNTYHGLFQALNTTVKNLDMLASNGFLPYCSGIDKNAAAPAVEALTYYSLNLDSDLGPSNILDLALNISSSDRQLTIQTAMANESSVFYLSTFQNSLGSAISDFLNQVRGFVYLASPVYYNYMNSGNLMCRNIRSPLNGTWAAAGMIGIFWIPASICLFFTSSYLYKVHKRKRLPITVEQVQPVVIPQTTIVTPVVATAPVIAVDTAPIITPAVMVEAPVIASTTLAPAMYPVIGDDSIAIIEAL